MVISSGSWRLGLRTYRAAAALLCLAAEIAAGGVSPWLTALSAVFACYSVYLLFRPPATGSRDARLGLFVGTVFFLIFAAAGADPGAWLSTSLYLYLLLESVSSHKWRATLAVAGSCLAFVITVPGHWNGEFQRLVLFGGILASLMAWQRRIPIRTEVLERILREEADQARAEERQRIAGDFHDGPLQAFIGFQMRLDTAEELLRRDFETGLENLARLRQTIRSQVGELRTFLRSMRPAEVEPDGLPAALRGAVEDFEKDTGIPASFSCPETEFVLPPEAALEVLQILREALHNVWKHARATRVAVAVERDNAHWRLVVEDDGAGFAFSGALSLDEMERLRVGPRSIQRRVRSLGGDLVVDSRPAQGARLCVRVPA